VYHSVNIRFWRKRTFQQKSKTKIWLPKNNYKTMATKKLFILIISFLCTSCSAQETSGSSYCTPTMSSCAPPKKPTLAISKITLNYPICFYDVELGAVNNARKNWPTYSKSLAEALRLATHTEGSVVVVNSRNVVVRTTKFRHKQIAKMWPELACIGQSGGDTSDKRRQACTRFIKSTILESKENSDEPICQTFFE